MVEKQTQGISNYLKFAFKKKNRNVECFVENLDLQRYNRDQYIPLLSEFLKKKFADRKFEIIITIGTEALDFLLFQKEDFFPLVPAVFCAADMAPESIKSSTREITGITGLYPTEEIVQIASEVQPELDNFIIISPEKELKPGFGTDTHIFSNKNAVPSEKIIRTGPDIRTLESIIALRKGPVALIFDNYLDDSSPFWSELSAFALRNNIPVYSRWKYPGSKGIVSGFTIIPDKEGQTAVNMAMRIINGKKAGTIPFFYRQSARLIFDYNMLEKFSIDQSLLPEGAIITDRNYSALHFLKPMTILIYSSFLLIIIIIILLINIHKRKVTEKNLRISEERFKSIYENSTMGIYRTTPDGKVIMANPALVSLLGYSSFDELEKRNLETEGYTKGYEREEFKRRLEELGSLKDFESVWKKKSGEFVYIRENATVIRDLKGNVLYYEGVVEDISDRKMTEEQVSRYIEELQLNKDLMEDNAKEFAELNARLSESEEQLLELNSNKDKFFSIISHDLRSPFNSLIGFSELLVNSFDDFKPAEVKNIIGSIHNSIMNIYKLIENLLHWSGIQTGKVRHNPGMIDLSEMVPAIIRLIEGNAIKKEISLLNEIPEKTLVYADEVMLHSIIQNLLSNSIKFTRPGGQVRLFCQNTSGMLEIAVSDSGIGMNQEKLERLFKIESNSSTPGTIGERGTGLGLIICKELVEKNGGSIRAESIPEVGTTFFFSIPLRPNIEIEEVLVTE